MDSSYRTSDSDANGTRHHDGVTVLEQNTDAQATLTFADMFPAGCLPLFAQAEVVPKNAVAPGALDNSCSGYGVGDGSDPNYWGDVVGTAVGTKNVLSDITGTVALGTWPKAPLAAAQDVVLTWATGNPTADAARIRVTAHWKSMPRD